MDSWSYPSQGKGFVSDESISAPDGIGRGKNGLMGWDFKTQCCYKSSLALTSEEAIENQGLVELGFPETMRKFWPENNFVKDVLSSKVGGERICTPTISTTNALSLEKESTSKFSSSVVESNSQNSSLIDLKLGRISDHRDAQDFRSSKAAPMLSSTESSMLVKRVRASLSSQTPFCQVYGCKKDLSSSKDYHKRHKVCEVHSKTAKVIVNNIEQRFCQQCSRFHLLAEFDGDKRSCRKRLAGHNERRRKPHVGIHSGRTGRLFQPCNGSRFQGSTLTSSSFVCQDIFPSNILHTQKYYTNDWSGHVKREDGGDYCPQSAIPITNGDLHPKSLFRHGFEKHSPPFHANGATLATGRDFNENSNHYPHHLGAPNSVSGAMIQNTSIGSEDFILFDSASNVQGLSGMSASDLALSLLSSQSQNSSSHSSGIPMAQPLIISGSHAHYSASQVSGKLLGVSPQASISGVSNKLNSSWMNSVEENHFGPILISDGIDAINFNDGIFQGSQYINSKDRLSCEDGPTIDLLQLSSQLQRVEHQRQSMQLKQGNDAFGGLKFTSAVQE